MSQEWNRSPLAGGSRGESLASRPGRLTSEETVLAPSDCGREPAKVSVQSGASSRQFGDYELLEEIAHGAMGVVYKARQISLNRLVALKMILTGGLASEEEVKRFRTEAESAANLDHPNIVHIYEVGQHEGRHFFSMKLVEGRNLAEMVTAGDWRVDEGKNAAHLMSKVARAAHLAHQHGILHRDLKPANILVDAQGEPHVTDFGLAKLVTAESSATVEGTVLGTPSYMAPEQAAGKSNELTAAADIYSLGAIFYFLLTGRPPFVSESPLDTLVQVLESDAIRPRAANPRVLADLESICLRCLEKSPARRYGTAAALAEDLERFLRGDPVETHTKGFGASLRHWARRQPALASRLGALAFCLATAQATYQLRHHVTLTFHLAIMCMLGVWGMVSGVCQWQMSRNPGSKLVRFVWAGADVALLTAVLQIDKALDGPMLAAYPALITASGLWFRPAIVAFSTIAAVVGHAYLVGDAWLRDGRVEQLNWHVIFSALLVVTGFVVTYLVHRVRALSRYYENRPLP